VQKKCNCTITLLKRVTKKCDRTIALFKRATKKCDRTIALFKRAPKKCYCTIALFKWQKSAMAFLKRANVQKSAHFWMCKLPNKQFWAIACFENLRSLCLKSEKIAIKKITLFCTFSLIRSFGKKKVWFWNLIFGTFLHTLFSKAQLCDHTLFALMKSAIAQYHFWKEWQKVRSHNPTFEKSNKKCDRTIALLKRAKMCDVQMWDCPTLVESAVV